jgi:iron complex outermembrane receptor protein
MTDHPGAGQRAVNKSPKGQGGYMSYRSAMICGAAAVAMLYAVEASAKPLAQDQQQGPASSAQPQVAGDQGAPTEAAATVEELVVTGSRTIRDGSAAPTPVTTLTTQALNQTAPSNIPDALNRLPQFLGSASQYHSVTFNATSGLQGNYLNLRGLGPQRVLVLLDGARVPPTSSSNAVDSNIIPQMLVERVDVVTGGASAAYGSDAVSGVVNYVLNKRFNGLTVQAQKSMSGHGGDADAYRLGLAAGTGFADSKGHAEFSVEHYENDGIKRQSDRPYYDDLALIVGSGAASNRYTQITNAHFNDVTFGGLVRSGPFAGSKFNPDGTLSPFVSGTATGTSNVVVGGEGAFQPPTVLVPKLDTSQAFGRVSYDFTDSISGYIQGGYARSQTSYLSAFATRRAGTSNGITIFADNPYLAPSVQTALGATPSFGLSRLFADAPGNQQTSTTTSYNIQAGLSGKFGSSFQWDIGYVHGNAKLALSQVEQNNRNFYASIDAVRAPNGSIVCGVTLRNPGLVSGCVPMNVMGEGKLDPAALAFIRQASRSQVENTLDNVSVNLRGDLFELPAGPVAFAVGGEMRWQKIDQTSNANPAVAVDYTGIRGVPTGVLPFATTNVGIANGEQTVKEVYGELNVPLLRDAPLARRLELNGAARYTDYKTSGAVETWKVGGIYEPVEGLRFRATASRDIAAPSLFDLFAGPQASVGTNTDRLTQLTSLSTIITAGNLNLKPEKADTLVGGVVFSPTFVPRLTVSIDAYRIKINDAIGTTSSQDELNDCHTSGGTAPVCALISRPFPYSNTTAANFPTQIIVSPQNLAQITVKGVDFEVNYNIPLENLGLPGSLDLRGFVSYLDTYNTKPSANAAVVKRAGTVTATGTTAGLPQWRGMLQQAYRSNTGFTAQVSERFTGSYRRTANEAFDPAFDHAPNKVYTDLYLSQATGEGDRYTLFFQVDNLFDVNPPVLPATVNPGFTYPTDKTLYDVLGRNFTAGVRLKF